MAYRSGTIITDNDELRIVMVGKTGIGKSASANTILGRKYFESKCSGVSLTKACDIESTNVDGQKVSVIDTPGLFDTRYGKEKTAKDLGMCISLAAPGPHIFLVVVAIGRFTEEEKKTVQIIQQIFGEAANKYSMVLFTHGDNLDSTIKDFLNECPELQELVSRCNGQYHVFNNKVADKKPQVRELLQKIRNIVKKNGGSHYTNEDFQEAERINRMEEERIMKEKEEQIRKEKEEIERQIREKYQAEMQKFKEQLQAEREREREEMEEKMRKMKMDMNAKTKQQIEQLEAKYKADKMVLENHIQQLQLRINREIQAGQNKVQFNHKAIARKKAKKTTRRRHDQCNII